MGKRLGEVSAQLIARNEVSLFAAPSRLGTQRLAMLDHPPPPHEISYELGFGTLEGRDLVIPCLTSSDGLGGLTQISAHHNMSSSSHRPLLKNA